MPVADAHVDALWKVYEQGLDFRSSSLMQADYESLVKGSVAFQVFAVFVSTRRSAQQQLTDVLGSIGQYYAQFVHTGLVRPVLWRQDLTASMPSELEIDSPLAIGGLLSLEGAACLQGSIYVLNALAELGIRGIGLTWNGPNDLADGCMEARGGGLTAAGKRIVKEMESLQLWLDLAHLSDAGVRDVFATNLPHVMASHANARAVHDHPRNLPDDTILEIIRRDGWIGMTFEASFVHTGPATVDSVFRHVDHVLQLGGENHLGLGSDFDGLSTSVLGLSSAKDYPSFAERLRARYGEVIARKLLHDNLMSYFARQLPSHPVS